MIERLLSWLLWLANREVPQLDYLKFEFYAMKARILNRFGEMAGHDWQHIFHECWGCHGSGCARCNGTGAYLELWVFLIRWRLAGRIFHEPAGRTAERPLDAVRYAGLIRHRPSGHAGCEAMLWLALLFDRKLFWVALTWEHGLIGYLDIRYPLQCLGRMLLWFAAIEPYMQTLRNPGSYRSLAF